MNTSKDREGLKDIVINCTLIFLVVTSFTLALAIGVLEGAPWHIYAIVGMIVVNVGALIGVARVNDGKTGARK